MKRRPKPISAKQLALQGVDLRMTHPELERFPTRKPQPGEKRPRGYRPAFLGAIVPVPVDDRGSELVLGPFRVLQNTFGEHFVFDYRAPLAKGDVFYGSKRACVVEMVRLHKSSPTGPT